MKALRKHLMSTQRAREQSDFVIPSEPKILRLVHFISCNSEILTRLEDEVVLDKKWETKMFHIWTVPKNGKVQYSLLLFYKGGLVYKSTVKCVFSKCGDSDVIFLNKVSFKKEFVGLVKNCQADVQVPIHSPSPINDISMSCILL